MSEDQVRQLLNSHAFIFEVANNLPFKSYFLSNGSTFWWSKRVYLGVIVIRSTQNLQPQQQKTRKNNKVSEREERALERERQRKRESPYHSIGHDPSHLCRFQVQYDNHVAILHIFDFYKLPQAADNLSRFPFSQVDLL